MVGDKASNTRVYKLWFEPWVLYIISTSFTPAVGGKMSGCDFYTADSTATVRARLAAGYEFVSCTDGGPGVSLTPTYTYTVSG